MNIYWKFILRYKRFASINQRARERRRAKRRIRRCIITRLADCNHILYEANSEYAASIVREICKEWNLTVYEERDSYRRVFKQEPANNKIELKARVIATGKIVEVSQGIYSPYQYVDDNGTIYTEEQLEILQKDSSVIFTDPTLDYWTRLEHQVAIAAMGGMCGNTKYNDYAWDDMANFAIKAAHILVEKLKEKEERK